MVQMGFLMYGSPAIYKSGVRWTLMGTAAAIDLEFHSDLIRILNFLPAGLCLAAPLKVGLWPPTFICVMLEN